jgi:hypothetical protein
VFGVVLRVIAQQLEQAAGAGDGDLIAAASAAAVEEGRVEQPRVHLLPLADQQGIQMGVSKFRLDQLTGGQHNRVEG